MKIEADQCDFKCASANCTVQSTLVQDQIIIGRKNDEIRKNALKNQWGLDDLIKNGRALEAAPYGANQIKQEQDPVSVSRIAKPGKYSRKAQGKWDNTPKYNNKPTQPVKSDQKTCTTCSNKKCRGGKNCVAYDRECFDCGKTGHFRGAAACSKKAQSRASRRVQTKLKQPSESSDDEQSIPESTESDSESDSGRTVMTRPVAQHVTRIRRMRRKVKHIRKTSKAPWYEVEVVINGEITKAYADTGADISVISKSHAKKLGLQLCKTEMSIKPYGSKAVGSRQCYIDTIMYGDNVANACVYVVKQEVEFLLSGMICEELRIIEFNPLAVRHTLADASPHKTRLAAAYPKLFADKVGRLKDYQVKFYINESVQPVAERRRPAPFHLRTKVNRELEKLKAEGIIEEHEGPAPWI